MANFTANEWHEFRVRLIELEENNMLSNRDKKILAELIYNQKTTAELARLAQNDEKYNWMKSNQNKPISLRRIQQILTKYYPEFHIQTTHKKQNLTHTVRKEQAKLVKIIITDNSVCGKCGSKEDLEIHHLMPVIFGGGNDERNLIILCKNCHQKATDYFNHMIRKFKRENKILHILEEREKMPDVIATIKNDTILKNARNTIKHYRDTHDGNDPVSDMTSHWFVNNEAFYELKYDSQKKEWLLTEFKKSEEVKIDA